MNLQSYRAVVFETIPVKNCRKSLPDCLTHSMTLELDEEVEIRSYTTTDEDA